MKPPFSRLLLLLSLAAFGSVRAQTPWEHLGVGMGEEQVSALLGQPLIVNGGHGYVHWTFDSGGSVMFREGSVLFWGTPKGIRAASSSRARLTIAAPVLEAPAVSLTAIPEQPAPVAMPVSPIAAPQAPGPDFRPAQTAVRVQSFAEITKS
jgi:hypothetical protein